MEQVFISYSRKDLGFVKRLAADLQAAGLKVWYDLSGLEAGTRWGKEIQNALRQSRFFLVVLSPNSCESEWVEREFLYASNLKLKVIPLLYRPCDLPLWSLNLHFMELQEENYQSNLPDLLKIMGVEAKPEKEVPPPAMALPVSQKEKEELPPPVTEPPAFQEEKEELQPAVHELPASLLEKEEPQLLPVSLDAPAAEATSQPPLQAETLAGIEQAVSREGGKNKKQESALFQATQEKDLAPLGCRVGRAGSHQHHDHHSCSHFENRHRDIPTNNHIHLRAYCHSLPHGNCNSNGKNEHNLTCGWDDNDPCSSRSFSDGELIA